MNRPTYAELLEALESAETWIGSELECLCDCESCQKVKAKKKEITDMLNLAKEEET